MSLWLMQISVFQECSHTSGALILRAGVLRGWIPGQDQQVREVTATFVAMSDIDA